MGHQTLKLHRLRLDTWDLIRAAARRADLRVHLDLPEKTGIPRYRFSVFASGGLPTAGELSSIAKACGVDVRDLRPESAA